MHKLSKEEGQELRKAKASRRHPVPFKEEIDSLGKGEMICIKAEDWKYKTPPYFFYYSHYNRIQKTVSVIKRGDDYFVEKL
jgi:hypothetical protein